MMCSKATILVVEDHDDLRTMWTVLFSKAGMNVLSARTIEDACRAFKSGVTIDAILVDYKLPDGNGTRLLSLVGDKLPKVRILITGYDITHPGFSACFTKPVNVYAMCELVRSKLEESYAACA